LIIVMKIAISSKDSPCSPAVSDAAMPHSSQELAAAPAWDCLLSLCLLGSFLLSAFPISAFCFSLSAF
jgi:hypothetical protein